MGQPGRSGSHSPGAFQSGWFQVAPQPLVAFPIGLSAAVHNFQTNVLGRKSQTSLWAAWMGALWRECEVPDDFLPSHDTLWDRPTVGALFKEAAVSVFLLLLSALSSQDLPFSLELCRRSTVSWGLWVCTTGTGS